MPDIIPVRGRVYRADLGHGLKPWLVVSNNARNNNWDDCLAVRITTSSKTPRPTVVALSQADHPLVGNVLCDNMVILYREEIKEDLGALSPQTMVKVGAGLMAALALS